MIRYSGTCPVCSKRFDATKAKVSDRARVTCSRSCAVSLSWKSPEAKERRVASIKIERQSPAAQARLAAHNERRWAKPEEHTKLSEWNRQRWSDPKVKKELSEAIYKAQAKPEYRAALSARKVELWKNPAYRESHTEAVRRALSTPENRARASRALRARWADPEKRARMLRGIQKTLDAVNRKRHAQLSDAEVAVLDTIISTCDNGIYRNDLRSLCRDAGVSSCHIEKIISGLIIKRRVVKMRKVPGALRVVGRGISA